MLIASIDYSRREHGRNACAEGLGTERTAEVIKVPVYQWALPHDLQPLRESVHAIANGGIDVILKGLERDNIRFGPEFDA